MPMRWVFFLKKIWKDILIRPTTKKIYSKDVCELKDGERYGRI